MKQRTTMNNGDGAPLEVEQGNPRSSNIPLVTGAQSSGQGDGEAGDAKDRGPPEADSFEEWVEWKKWKAKQVAGTKPTPSAATTSNAIEEEPTPISERKKESDLQEGSPKIKTQYVLSGQPTGWAAMAKIVRDFDEEQLQNYKEDMDTLLVFVSGIALVHAVTYLSKLLYGMLGRSVLCGPLGFHSRGIPQSPEHTRDIGFDAECPGAHGGPLGE